MSRTTSLVEKVDAIHQALTEAGLSHAFGGALALAWCVGEPRATIDIDVNVFVAEADAVVVRGALPSAVEFSDADTARLAQEGQVRVWWDTTPIDIFLNSTPLHESAAARAHWEVFGDKPMPFLSCLDTAIFKAFFNRTKDWADLEAMRKAGRLDVEAVRLVLIDALGEGDERVRVLDRLAKTGRAFEP